MMLKSEMQHQFWITKKAVQRKLGSKEDDCIVSSDADLDAKIELFKSITESCGNLYKLIDQYQERLCILSQEENSLGKFLKEAGKRSNTTGKNMVTTGKAISYCGQQRMTLRSSLVRLHHEIEVFRYRAIVDTQSTINQMERERTEYRAALCWMKSASGQLDPDSRKGLEKFRKSQNHVRVAKSKFDKLSMDTIQKIDLLAAARCNMFSHTLAAYMLGLLQFSKKASETFKMILTTLNSDQQYDFCVLKELTQNGEKGEEEKNDTYSDIINLNTDSDKFCFFSDDYSDQTKNDNANPEEIENIKPIENKIDLIELTNIFNLNDDVPLISTANLIDNNLIASPNVIELSNTTPLSLNQHQIIQSNNLLTNDDDNKKPKNLENLDNNKKNQLSSWLELFSDLDPLANPDAFAKTLNGTSNNFQDA